MSLISKETVLQERIITVIENLKIKIEDLRRELMECCEMFNKVCNEHIESGYRESNKLAEVSLIHQKKSEEFDIHKKLLDIISDYADINGYLPDYQEMIDQLENLMLNYAQFEEYEIAASIKKWHSSFYEAIMI